jgi:hypothetical protein
MPRVTITGIAAFKEPNHPELLAIN